MSLALGDFILVMREDIVDPTGVQVEGRAKVRECHGAALNMPSGKSAAPGAIPGHFAAGLRRLPEREVLGMPLVGIVGASRGRQRLGELVTGQGAVGWKLRDVEEYVPMY